MVAAAIIKLKFHLLDPYSRCMFCVLQPSACFSRSFNGTDQFWILMKQLDRNAFNGGYSRRTPSGDSEEIHWLCDGLSLNQGCI